MQDEEGEKIVPKRQCAICGCMLSSRTKTPYCRGLLCFGVYGAIVDWAKKKFTEFAALEFERVDGHAEAAWVKFRYRFCGHPQPQTQIAAGVAECVNHRWRFTHVPQPDTGPKIPDG